MLTQHKTTVNEQTNLKNHVSKFVGYIKSSQAQLVIWYTFIVTLNPGFTVDYTLMFNMVRTSSKIAQTVTMGAASFVLGLLLLCWFWLTSKRQIDPVKHVYFWNIFSIFSFLIVMFIWMNPQNAMWVYIGASLLIVTEYLIVAICILVGIQLISRYIEEGYESFSINAVVGINNIAANLSQLFGTGSVSIYLQQSKYSKKSVLYVFLIFVESAFIPLILFYYLITVRNQNGRARKRLNSQTTDTEDRMKTHSRDMGSLLLGGVEDSGKSHRSGQL
jgi:hypothetical protein